MITLKLSVILPCYNVEQFVARAVESCKLTTPDCELEIICVDDCSTDGTFDVIRKLAEKRPNLKVVHHEANRKLLEARRNGIKVATGDYILHLDPDDYFAEGILDSIAESLKANPVDVLCFGGKPVLADNSLVQDESVAARIKSWEKVLMPPENCESREDLLDALFVSKTYAWCIWGKVWKADIVRKCFEFMPSGPFMVAEDTIQCLVSMYFVRTFSLLRVCGYNYSTDTGCTAGDLQIIEKAASRLNDLAVVMRAICSFRNSLAADDSYLYYLQSYERNILKDFWLYCEPYVRGYKRYGGGIDEAIKQDHLGLLALWQEEDAKKQELLCSTKWFWRLYREWLKIKLLFNSNESDRHVIELRRRQIKTMFLSQS